MSKKVKNKSITVVIIISLYIIILIACEKKIEKVKILEEATNNMVIIGENDEKYEKPVDNNDKYVNGEVIVMIKKGYSDLSKCSEQLLRNAKEIFRFSDDNNKKYEMIVLVKNDKLTTEELIEKLKDLQEVANVEPNYIYGVDKYDFYNSIKIN